MTINNSASNNIEWNAKNIEALAQHIEAVTSEGGHTYTYATKNTAATTKSSNVPKTSKHKVGSSLSDISNLCKNVIDWSSKKNMQQEGAGEAVFHLFDAYNKFLEKKKTKDASGLKGLTKKCFPHLHQKKLDQSLAVQKAEKKVTALATPYALKSLLSKPPSKVDHDQIKKLCMDWKKLTPHNPKEVETIRAAFTNFCLQYQHETDDPSLALDIAKHLLESIAPQRPLSVLDNVKKTRDLANHIEEQIFDRGPYGISKEITKNLARMQEGLTDLIAESKFQGEASPLKKWVEVLQDSYVKLNDTVECNRKALEEIGTSGYEYRPHMLKAADLPVEKGVIGLVNNDPHFNLIHFNDSYDFNYKHIDGTVSVISLNRNPKDGTWTAESDHQKYTARSLKELCDQLQVDLNSSSSNQK